ncbi:MAG: 30S ribosomal protein S4 [Pseudomonadota bacterium]
MANYLGPACRLCRRENMKLFLKGDRCYSDRCAVERRSYAPGQHGQSRGKVSNYGLQLREKQRVKRTYGLYERQFHNYFEKAESQKGITGTNLLVLLERRLDNVMYRMGFASSRTQARQLITHSHFLINGKKVTIPSYFVREGDVIEVKEASRAMLPIKDSLEAVVRRGVPQWLEVDTAAFKGTVKAYPRREDLTMPIQEQLIVELYSR